jgi:cytochrome c556
LIAALGQAVINPDMDDADDEDYSRHAAAMIEDALQTLRAARLGDQAGAAKSMNSIEKRCSSCHEDWR